MARPCSRPPRRKVLRGTCSGRRHQHEYTLRSLPVHPEPAVSWHSGFRGGAHARPKTTSVHHVARRRGRVAAGGESARQPAVREPPRTFRQGLKATREGERGRAVRRSLFGLVRLRGAMAVSAAAENAPGVTDSEIKIGQTMPYTGPGAWLSSIGLAEKAYMQMINDQGGINDRKINLISVDDGFLLWRTGMETRKLVEVERVAFMFGSLGTPTQLAVAKYLNERKIAQLFIASGAYRWGNYKETPYTIGGLAPSNRLGARLYTRHILQQDPNARICILHEDTDFGRDYTAGVRDVLGDKYAATVMEATY